MFWRGCVQDRLPFFSLFVFIFCFGDRLHVICRLKWAPNYKHVFPIMPFYTIALTIWSFYLYLHVKKPYRFEIPVAGADTTSDDGVEDCAGVPKSAADSKE